MPCRPRNFRLNTPTRIDVARLAESCRGVAGGGDLSGFPDGRRPIDDVVGSRCAPNGRLADPVRWQLDGSRSSLGCVASDWVTRTARTPIRPCTWRRSLPGHADCQLRRGRDGVRSIP